MLTCQQTPANDDQYRYCERWEGGAMSSRPLACYSDFQSRDFQTSWASVINFENMVCSKIIIVALWQRLLQYLLTSKEPCGLLLSRRSQSLAESWE